MSLRSLCIPALLAMALAACGGDPVESPGPSQAATTMSKASGRMAAPLTAEFAKTRSNYVVTKLSSTSVQVAPIDGSTPTSLPIATRLRFRDMTVSFEATGLTGQAYRIYQAAFNRTPDAAGIGYWVNALDNGYALKDMASFVVASAEFKALYGEAPTSQQLVEKFYLNVLQRVGDPAGMTFWRGVLDRRAATVAEVLVAISEGAENQINMLPRINAGIQYLEPGIAYAPSANAGPNRSIGTSRYITLDGSASTAVAGKTLTYQWTLQTRPEGSNAELVLSNTVAPVFLADLPGIYEAALVVSDGTLSSAPALIRMSAQWAAPAGETPASGNYIYLSSDSGDYIGGGRSYLYTRADAALTMSGSGNSVRFSVRGDQDWSGDFVGMNSITKLVPGFYGDLTRYPFNNAVKGGLSWSGEGRGCNSLTGWFIVDSVTYNGSNLTAIDMRFEQHCEGGASALRGQIHWAAVDETPLPGPVTPEPAGLWTPEPGVTPATNNYIYLSSTGGDYIGGGRTYLYTQVNATLRVNTMSNGVSVSVGGNQSWSATFVPMNALGKLEKGYYGNLSRYPFHNPIKGGLSWGGEGRGCNTLSGWFVVEDVTYVNGNITALDLRFEQHCEGGSSALRGKIHWAPGDTSVPPGPL